MNGDRTESVSDEHAVSVSAQSVRLWRFLTDSRSVTYRPYNPEAVESEPGTWYPLAEAEALEAVEVAASVGRRDGWGAQAQYDMARALSVLHNLRNAALRSKL